MEELFFRNRLPITFIKNYFGRLYPYFVAGRKVYYALLLRVRQAWKRC
ncbi:MAG: hypothetical protein LBN37_02610 [Bacteroidales bacterium]|nr:hypothetical protein [Bacteroidales bacterium]